MEKLFSPWRSKYIQSFSKTPPSTEECVLCEAYRDKDDDKHYIVTRGKHSFVLLNLYPYNSGHLMVVPYRHLPSIVDLNDEESLEVMSFTRRMMNALKQVSRPDGFNFGSNVGRTAGAGIDQHIHFHIVPRWNGDSNFMPVLADTKVISEDMSDTMHRLRTSANSLQ